MDQFGCVDAILLWNARSFADLLPTLAAFHRTALRVQQQ